MKIQSSFTSASTFPWKLFADGSADTIIRGRIQPIHVQLNPTNACPFNCSFCSCKNRDRGKSMDIDIAKRMIAKFATLGTKAVTITGGGDPLAYPHINDLIDIIHSYGMKIGLVTNGFYFYKLKEKTTRKITWCRISLSDELTELPQIPTHITSVDWAFSYVLLSVFNKPMCIKAIKFANKHNFTHIRLVEDILHKSVSVNDVKAQLMATDIDLSRVIFQGRKTHTHGRRNCLISLLKPNIDAEFNLFACCGIQYATADVSMDFNPRLVMANLSNPEVLDDIYNSQKHFDGSVCVKCFYDEYNDCLEHLSSISTLKHKEFI